MLLREASATTSSAGNARSARMVSISRPTLPVAPTTATLNPMAALRERIPPIWGCATRPASRRERLTIQRRTEGPAHEFIEGLRSLGRMALNQRSPSCKRRRGRRRCSGRRPIVRLEIRLDRLGVGVADRGAERLDHLGHLGIPGGGAHERRVHLDVVEAVAGGAIALDLLDAGRLLELDRLLVGERRHPDDGGDDRDGECTHGSPPHATSSVTLCMTL